MGLFSFFSLIAKFFSFWLRLFHLGYGETFISNYYLKFFPESINFSKFSFQKGVILITGTNGKTTTSKLLAEILQKIGFKVLYNQTGGNILRSILGFFLISYRFFQKNTYDYLVLEVDEGSIPEITKYLKPKIFVLLNFSRDQLDRYFEIENISQGIVGYLKRSPKTLVVFNSSDGYCNQIVESIPNRCFEFQKNLELLKNSNFTEEFMGESLDAISKVLLLEGIQEEIFLPLFKKLKKAYGRGEIVKYKKINFEIHLVKNPASFNRNLFELVKNNQVSNVLIILNDDISDGTDISWIYDIDPELIKEAFSKKNLYFSGRRAFEMATRVKYAVNHFNLVDIDRNLKEVVSTITKKPLQDVFIFSNYSGMLSLRKILTGRKVL